jgi:uncharacterized protein (DUF1330 family)
MSPKDDFNVNIPSSEDNNPDINPKAKKQSKKWLKDIKESERVLEQEEKKWKRYKKYYKNEFHGFRSNDDRITVNYPYALIRASIPQLYFKDPGIAVNTRKQRSGIPTKLNAQQKSGNENIDGILEQATGIAQTGSPFGLTPEDRSPILESVDNYLIKELRVKKEVKKCILDTFLSIGYMKVGYTFDVELEASKLDGIVDYNEKIKRDSVHIYRLSPKQVVVPIGYDDMDRMPWIAIKYLFPVDDVKNNSSYKNVSQVKGSKINVSDFFTLDKPSKQQESQEDFVLVYEIWDKRNQEVILITDAGIELQSRPWPFMMDGFPVVDMKFNEVPDEYYPVPDVKYIEAQTLELNRYRTKQMEHVRRFGRKYAVNDGLVNPEELSKLARGEDGVILKFPDNAGTAVSAISDAPMPSDNRFYQEDIKQDMRVISGFDEQQFGALSRGATTATESSIVEANKKLRIDEKADIVVDFIKDIFRKVNQLVNQLYTPDQIIAITGDNNTKWEPTDEEDEIKGEYDVKIEAGSTLPLTEEIREQKAITAIQILSSPLFAQHLNIPGILSEFMKTQKWIKNPDDWVNIEQNEAEAASHASKENQLMALGRPVQATPDENHLVHMKGHMQFLDALKGGELDEIDPTGTASQLFLQHLAEHEAMLAQAGVDIQSGGSPVGGSQPSPGSPQATVNPNISPTPGGLPTPDPATDAFGVQSGNNA